MGKQLTHEEMKQTFDQTVLRLYERFQQFAWDDKEVYAVWLAQTFYLVNQTTRLLSMAAGRLSLAEEALHKVCLQGIREEKGHDLLALRDLEAMGYELADIPELPGTVAVYAHQFYRIDRTGPTSLFGHSLMLEGLADRHGDEMLGHLEKVYGKKKTTFFRVHARVDKGHYGEGLDYLRTLTPEQRTAVVDNLLNTQVIYGHMLDGIEAHCAAAKPARHNRVA